MNKIVYRIRKWIRTRERYLTKRYKRVEELEIKALIQYQKDIDVGEMFFLIDKYLNDDERKEYYEEQVSFGTIDSYTLDIKHGEWAT
jgi:hypothetical protein|tara:strand:+ start:533 stop:793 length:261 start_codon:yes stop_codon:yes gene_type:complete